VSPQSRVDHILLFGGEANFVVLISVAMLTGLHRTEVSPFGGQLFLVVRLRGFKYLPRAFLVGLVVLEILSCETSLLAYRHPPVLNQW
jgi:hypothetical protein